MAYRATPIHRRLLIILAVGALLVAMLPAAASAAGVGDKASGSGHITVDGKLRTFSFSVREMPDGSFQGRAQRHYRATGAKLQMALEYLIVEGDTAYACGDIVKSTTPELIGVRAIFKVVDNGEGQSADPDQISPIWWPIEVECWDTYYGLDITDFFDIPEYSVLYDVERGNVQVN